MINYIDKLLYNEMLFSESELFRTSLGVSFLFKLIENSFFEELWDVRWDDSSEDRRKGKIFLKDSDDDVLFPLLRKITSM